MTIIPTFADPEPDQLDRAISEVGNPGSQAWREARTWATTWDEEPWGPAGDPGGDPLVIDGDVGILGGRRIPVRVQHGVAYIGEPARFGQCGQCAELACTFLLERGAAPVYVIGRLFGAHQQWVEFQSGDHWYVLDAMLDDQPWPRELYYAALHARAGTRLTIPDRAAVDALRHVNTLGSRAEVLKRLAPAGVQQIKE